MDMKARKTTPLIDMRGVSFVYRKGEPEEVVAVRDVDMQIHRGEFVAVVGANGSGKSTLAKLTNALLLPTEGKVFVDGMQTDLREHLWDVRRTVGMVFQNPDNQLVSTTVEQEVAFGLENLGIPTEDMHRRVDKVLTEVGMADSRDQEPHNLSGGQKQRVAIASVLAMEPACLVLDEATSMLDPQGRADVMEAARFLTEDRGLTVVCITHFMDEAAEADRIVALKEGQIAADGSPEDIFGGGLDLESIGLQAPAVTRLAENLRADGLSLSAGMTDSEQLVGEICRLYLNR